MRENYQDIKEWFPIQNYQGNEIQLKNFNKICVYKVTPINFRLKTLQEQECILKEFQQFLKNKVSFFQIVIQSDRINLEDHFHHLKMMNAQKKELTQMIEDYIYFVKNVAKKRESISRKYYLIMPKIQNERVFSSLQEMENEVTKLEEKETEEMLKRCFKKCTAIRRDAKWV